MKTLFSTLLTVFVLGFAMQTVYAAGEIKADSLAAAKKHFATAKGELEAMLVGQQPLSYERAIYLLENAYWEGTLNAADFSETLDGQTARIRNVLQANRNPKGYIGTLGWMETEADKRAKYEKAITNFAIFTYLTDTTFFVEKNGKMRYHLPLRYTHKDPMGSIAWSNTQVTNLLQNGHGNCFALASLYYIFSERLGGEARLCTAPGHLYINHPDDKGTRFNVELSSGTFPGNGTIMTQSYATMEAVKSGIALRELSRKQAVALTLVYLAKGYAHKFGTTSDAFVLSCAESALRIDSLNLNALLLKADVLENRLLLQGNNIAEVQSVEGFKEYEQLLAKLYKLGYREMPLEMKNILMAGFQRDTLPYKTRNYTSQPFKKYGMENDRHASLSWGLFDEMHETKATERFGNTLLNTKIGKITGFAKKEVLYNDYDFDPVAFAWNVDPLAAKYPAWSPYAFCVDNPILCVDKDGKEAHIYGADAANTVAALRKVTSLSLIFDARTNQMSYVVPEKPKVGPPVELSKIDKQLMKIMDSKSVDVGLHTTRENSFTDARTGNEYDLIVGSYQGHTVTSDACSNPNILNKITTRQLYNYEHSQKLEGAKISTAGQDIFHEMSESFEGVTADPTGEGDASSYGFKQAHKAAAEQDPDFTDIGVGWNPNTRDVRVFDTKNKDKSVIIYNKPTKP